MSFAVVDTNVLVVANGGSEQAGERCRGAVESALRGLERHGLLVLDEAGEILGEYYRNLHRGSQTRVGDRFFRWAIKSQIRFVRLDLHSSRGYQDFPDDPRLEAFDRDDRKFVAATVVSGTHETELLNAVDSDYSLFQVPLQEAGVRVNELCPEAVARA